MAMALTLAWLTWNALRGGPAPVLGTGREIRPKPQTLPIEMRASVDSKFRLTPFGGASEG